MPRPVKQSIGDLDVMADAVERLKYVMYAQSFYEKRYQDALRRVVNDLGDPWAYLHMAVDGRENLIQLLRSQFE
ncbi:hypothetical protein RY831_15205 [Noviherbaspirillum sp. CPCC 100848]|uniref:Uncharacterized protein n=1 Tax=Noviherbaspirillum album TaxID=3080276 RepID=A0ABU6JBJ0_9BURK|nr:hypothetical protein [Noviherbaspirillum sp. CPCC 100848]MEC4720509.1 hypothetical protein [Noviherbaspirillum sp. CPCC 100848]